MSERLLVVQLYAGPPKYLMPAGSEPASRHLTMGVFPLQLTN